MFLIKKNLWKAKCVYLRVQTSGNSAKWYETRRGFHQLHNIEEWIYPSKVNIVTNRLATWFYFMYMYYEKEV